MRSLNSFINEFTDGFQLNNRFVCKVIVPDALELTETEKAAKDWLARGILCESTNLPDRAFAETQMTQYGFTEQIPYHSEFTTLDCVFNTPLRSADNPVPRLFHKWQNLIQDLSQGYESSRDFTFSGTNHTNGYYGELQLGVFDRQNNLTLRYDFERVYPQTVQSTPVTWHEENEFTKLTCGFTFSVWHPSTDHSVDFFNEQELLRSVELGATRFLSSGFTPPQAGPFSILGGIATQIISDVTNGRVRIG